MLNWLQYRTGTGNTWNEKRVQHVRHTHGTPVCPPREQRLWLTAEQTATELGVGMMLVRRLVKQKLLPAEQVVKFAPYMIERQNLDLPAVRKATRLYKEGRRCCSSRQTDPAESSLFSHSSEV